MVHLSGAPVTPSAERFTCPVCGFPELHEPHIDAVGSPTYSICPSCGCQFGADDLEQSHAELRAAWLADGAQWWSQNQAPPPGWNGRAQLQRAGLADAPAKSESDPAHGRN
jgi:hypothetical protein